MHYWRLEERKISNITCKVIVDILTNEIIMDVDYIDLNSIIRLIIKHNSALDNLRECFEIEKNA